jgi:hypothetical protein
MPPKAAVPFANMVDLLKNMDPTKMQRIIKNHQDFHRLQTWCSAKKWIEVLPKMTGIKVLEYTPEVIELKRLVDELKPGGFKWLDENVGVK